MTASRGGSFFEPMMVSWHWTLGCFTTLLPVVCASHCTIMSMFAPWKLTWMSSVGGILSLSASALAITCVFVAEGKLRSSGSVARESPGVEEESGPVPGGRVPGGRDGEPSGGGFPGSPLLIMAWLHTSGEEDQTIIIASDNARKILRPRRTLSTNIVESCEVTGHMLPCRPNVVCLPRLLAPSSCSVGMLKSGSFVDGFIRVMVVPWSHFGVEFVSDKRLWLPRPENSVSSFFCPSSSTSTRLMPIC